MNEIMIICIITYGIIVTVLHVFMEKRLYSLHRANTARVPADDYAALIIIHTRLIIIVRSLSFLLLLGGIFILVTLL